MLNQRWHFSLALPPCPSLNVSLSVWVPVLGISSQGSFHYKQRFENTYNWIQGFPGGTSAKEPACQCRRCKRHRFDPWVRKIPWRKAWQKSQTQLRWLSMHAWNWIQHAEVYLIQLQQIFYNTNSYKYSIQVYFKDTILFKKKKSRYWQSSCYSRTLASFTQGMLEEFTWMLGFSTMCILILLFFFFKGIHLLI